MKTYKVYSIRNKRNKNPQYYGMTQNFSNRIAVHKTRANNDKNTSHHLPVHLWQAQVGFSNLIFEEVGTYTSREKARAVEKKLIKENTLMRLHKKGKNCIL